MEAPPALATSSFSIYCDADNIIHLTFSEIEKGSATNVTQAQSIEKWVRALFAAKPGQPFDAIADALEVDHITYLSSEAKEIYLGLRDHDQLRRVAFVMTGFWIRTMTSAFAQFTGKWTTTKWFTTKAEALEWLTQSLQKNPH